VTAAVFALLQSPRRRRRVLWGSALALGAAAAAAVVVLVPERNSAKESFSDQPAQVVQNLDLRLRPAERRQIQHTVDRFVLAALDRSDPALAWKLAGPDLRGSTTARDWVAGRMPIPAFLVKGTHFPGWTNVVVGRDSVLFDVVLQPRTRSGGGAIAYNAQVVRRGNGWAVNRWYPVATFAPAGSRPAVVGPNDYAASARGENSETQGTLAPQWIAVPIGLFALGLAAVMTVVGRNWLRYRRVRRAFAGDGSRELPALPRNVQRTRSEQ
jgi:hypothetical protein